MHGVAILDCKMVDMPDVEELVPAAAYMPKPEVAWAMFLSAGGMTSASSPEIICMKFSPSGPLYPALLAPDSTLPVKVEGAPDVEFLVREAGGQIYLLAAKREGSTVKVTFRGLPEWASTGELLYESPRKVTARDGSFSDWFGPNEVHAYRFARR